jgi:adenylate cyclase
MRSMECPVSGAGWVVRELEPADTVQPCNGAPAPREATPAVRSGAPLAPAITRLADCAGRRARSRRGCLERRPLPVFAADVVAYSHLIELDDVGTVLRLRRLRRRVLEPSVTAHRGRIFRVAGDGTLVAFGNACDAVACAIAIRQGVARLDRRALADLRLHLRMGIGLDDVIVGDDGDLHGRGVNLAARLEADAASGEILVCGGIFEQARGRIPVCFQALGERRLKNLSQPVSVYSVQVDGHTR